MDSSSIVETLDARICEEWGNTERISSSPESSRQFFISLLRCTRSEEEARSNFIHCYVLVCKSEMEKVILLSRCVLHALERQGMVFSDGCRTQWKEGTTWDHILLLLSRLCYGVDDIHIRTQLVDKMEQLLSCSQFQSLLPTTLQFVFSAHVGFLLDLQAKEQSKPQSVVCSIARGAIRVLNHPQWDNWSEFDRQCKYFQAHINHSIIQTFLDSLVTICNGNQEFPESYDEVEISSNSDRVTSFDSILQRLLTSFFLPALEDYLHQPKQSNLSSLCEHSPSIAALFIQLISTLSNPFTGSLWTLWCTCVKGWIGKNTWESENPLPLIILHCLTYQLQSSRSYASRIHCLNLLEDLLKAFTQHSIVLDIEWKRRLSLLLLSILSDQGHIQERIFDRCLQLLLFTLEETLHPPASHILLHLFSVAIKRDLDGNCISSSSSSSLRKHCFHLLYKGHVRFTLKDVYYFCLVPLLPLFQQLSYQTDVIQLIQLAIHEHMDDFLNLYPTFDIQHPQLLSFILSISTLPHSQLHLLNKGVDKSNLTDTTLLMLAHISYSEPSEQLETIAQQVLQDVFARADFLTPQRLDWLALFLIHSKQTHLLPPYLSSWISLANHTSLSIELSPSLQALTFLPFSFLQQSLIEISATIQSDDQLLGLLRLLRVIIQIVYEQHRKIDGDREEDVIRRENELNVRKLCCCF